MESNKKWPQFLAAGTATIASLTTCINSGWSTPFVPKLLSDDYPFDVTPEEASYITIVSSLGNICGGFIASNLIDVIGRQKTILLISIPHLLAFSLIALSYFAKELLYVARIFGGVSEGIAFSIVPLYVAEIAQKDIRGLLGTIVSMTHIGGMLLVNLVGSYLSIRDSALIFLVLPVIFLVSFWKMPESPYYLLMKNRNAEAEESLRFLRRRNDVSEELKNLTKDVNRQMEETGTFRDLFFIGVNRKALMIAIGARITQQATGCTAFLQYSQLLFKAATDSIQPHIAASIILLVQLAMAFMSSFIVDKFGRRPLLLLSTLLTLLDLVIQSIFFTFKQYSDLDMTVIEWFPLMMMIVYFVAFSFGLFVTVNILISELFSTSVKSKAMFVNNVFFALGMMGTIKFYQWTADNFGLALPFWSFSACTAVGLVFLYFYLPETKGRTLEEIQQNLRKTSVK